LGFARDGRNRILGAKKYALDKKTLSSRTHVRDLLSVHSGLSENPTKRSLVAALSRDDRLARLSRGGSYSGIRKNT